MKKTLLSLVLCFTLYSLNIKAQQLTFSYDAAGNQTERKWVCINCTSGKATAVQSAPLNLEMKLKLPDSAKTVAVKRTLVASPNPLIETLNVNWETEKGVSVKSIAVFSISGIKTHEVFPIPNQNHAALSFQRLAPGTYILYVTFSDQRKESIKVIKK